MTVGKIGSQWGYQYHRLVPTGSIRITARRAQDVLAGLTKQVRTTNNMYLYMPEDEGDADSLFDRMRIVAGGRHRTFRRDEADFVTVQFGQRYWLWSTGGDIIPNTVGATYTPAVLAPRRRIAYGSGSGARCQGGDRRYTPADHDACCGPLDGRNLDPHAGGVRRPARRRPPLPGPVEVSANSGEKARIRLRAAT